MGRLVEPTVKEAAAAADPSLPEFDAAENTITHQGKVHEAKPGTKFITDAGITYVMRAEKIIPAGWHKVRTLTEAQKAKLKASRKRK